MLGEDVVVAAAVVERWTKVRLSGQKRSQKTTLLQRQSKRFILLRLMNNWIMNKKDTMFIRNTTTFKTIKANIERTS